MVVKVDFFLLVGEILNELTSGDISFKIFDVLFDEFGLMSYWEVECVIAEAELE